MQLALLMQIALLCWWYFVESIQKDHECIWRKLSILTQTSFQCYCSSSKRQCLMINEIITRAIMRFAFEAEQLREVINYREACNLGVLGLADNFFFSAPGSRDLSCIEEWKASAERFIFKLFLALFIRSGKVHRCRWLYMKDPDPKPGEAGLRTRANFSRLLSQVLVLHLRICAGL